MKLEIAPKETCPKDLLWIFKTKTLDQVIPILEQNLKSNRKIHVPQKMALEKLKLKVLQTELFYELYENDSLIFSAFKPRTEEISLQKFSLTIKKLSPPNSIKLYATKFEAKILTTLCDLKDHKITYQDLAIKSGFNKSYSRATARALAQNPISWWVPCHKVVAKNTTATYNYRWGSQYKKSYLNGILKNSTM